MLTYIHIPFCDSKCHYCSFNSYTNLHDRIANYMQALKSQLLWDLERFNVEPNSLETLFIGGGTPSCVEPHYYQEVFEILKPYLVKNAEITTEANPNSASREWLEGMQAIGINRVSFGVQSFNNKKLQELNRAHNAKEAIEAIENAHNIGIKNISLDIIYDFYSDTKELITSDLKQAFALPINHISAYELTIEKATNFSKRPEVKKGSESLGYHLKDLVTKHGFTQYEVSNYGTYQSQHNIGYWQHKEYLGVGAGAVGYKNKERYYPNTNIDNYIKEPTKMRIEELTNQDILTEKIFLGLRSCVGVEQNILTKEQIKQADILVQEDKLYFKNGNYFNKEYFLSDEYALFIMQN